MNVSKLGMRLRAYDWMAAAIELVIVVVGILIALEVSNWNQGRQDLTRADGYYRRIHANLSTDEKNFGATLAYWGRVSAYGSGAIAYGESGQLVDGSAWKTVLAYYQASQTLPFVPSDASFTEMRSAGELGLIADENLRGRLEAYYSLSGVGGESIIREQDPAYRQQVRGLTPWSVQQYIWDRCYRESSYVDQGFVDCPSPISEPEALAILSNFKAAPSLLDNLRAWMSTLRISQIVLNNNRREAQQLAAQVERARQR
jgi:hypothetical protein